MQEAGFNTFKLHNGDIFLDMLTDSGVNAMSDQMQSAMLRADDPMFAGRAIRAVFSLASICKNPAAQVRPGFPNGFRITR